MPYEANFLDLDPDVTDPLGVPALRATDKLYANELRAQEYISGKLDEILARMGATVTWPGFPAGVPMPVNNHAYQMCSMYGWCPTNSRCRIERRDA